MTIALKRVYEEPSRDDGLRILVDRLWPRGLSKKDAAIDAWLKAVAPSHELRKWFHHEPERWDEFRQRYFAELDAEQDAVTELEDYVAKGKVTFVFAAKDADRNNAVVLKEYVSGGARTKGGDRSHS